MCSTIKVLLVLKYQKEGKKLTVVYLVSVLNI